MNLGTPIPANANFKDPLWSPHFYALANKLIMLGAKPKLITRYTGLATKAILERYKGLRGEAPPHGRMQQTLPKTYANLSNRGSLPFILQCAAFANIFHKIRCAIPAGEAVNDGWLLAKAFETHTRLACAEPGQPVLLTITHAYDIKSYITAGDLELVDCPECGGAHLLVTAAERDGQHCPMCLIQRRYVLLVENSAAITAAKLASAR